MASLSARSVVASTLLGTVPPRLAGHLLVAFASEFGINPGTTRVALSRMTERGELERFHDGTYALSGSLLERQRRQAAGLAPRPRPWTGEWEIVVVRPGRRDAAERATLRRAARHLGLRERREGTWMRPDNLDRGRAPTDRSVLASQADRFVGVPVDEADPIELVAELFDLELWAEQARRLDAEMASMGRLLEEDAAPPLASGFELSAETLRHLVADPLLPDPLLPADWPAPELRSTYERYDRVYRRRLSAFFRSRSRLAG